jgi:excisionase family DNA binding protein
MNIKISEPRETVLSHGVESLPGKTGLGRTFIFNEIRAKRLKAVKAGRRTLVRDEDLRTWLASLPAAGNRDDAA